MDEEFDELELAELEVEELELEELELDELLAVWPVSPVSLELQAASSREHINADKILGTAYLQAVLAMGPMATKRLLLLRICYAFIGFG